MSKIRNSQGPKTMEEALELMEPTIEYWVKKRSNVLQDSCIQRDDLLQEARMGVVRAFEMYDSRKGSFFSYASTWINSRVVRYIEKNLSIVFYPDNKYRRELIPNYGKLMRKFTQETPGLTMWEYKNMIADHMRCDISHVEDIAHEKGGIFHMDGPINGADFVARLQDRESSLPSDRLDGERVREFVLSLSRGMTAVEQCILQDRIMNVKPLTLAHIAAEYRLSRQRIEQIEKSLREWINIRCTKQFGPPKL